MAEFKIQSYNDLRGKLELWCNQCDGVLVTNENGLGNFFMLGGHKYKGGIVEEAVNIEDDYNPFIFSMCAGCIKRSQMDDNTENNTVQEVTETIEYTSLAILYDALAKLRQDREDSLCKQPPAKLGEVRKAYEEDREILINLWREYDSIEPLD